MDFLYDFALLRFGVLDVTEGLLLKVALQEEGLDIFELHEQLVEFFVVVFLDVGDLFTHAAELINLGLYFIVELANVAFEVFNL